jgi:hypothetical protein
MSDNIELCRLLESIRPKDYRVQIIRPDGTITCDRIFGTKAEASRWAKANRQPSDVAMTHFINSAANN